MNTPEISPDVLVYSFTQHAKTKGIPAIVIYTTVVDGVLNLRIASNQSKEETAEMLSYLPKPAPAPKIESV